MDKNEIAKTLKKYRQRSNMTGMKVIEKLKAKGIEFSVKALYNWETGRSQPDCDTFMVLCDIYGIEDIISAFGYEKKETSENNHRMHKDELLEKIELLDETICKIVSAYIDGLLTYKSKK